MQSEFDLEYTGSFTLCEREKDIVASFLYSETNLNQKGAA
jgi:hypothetical protein